VSEKCPKVSESLPPASDQEPGHYFEGRGKLHCRCWQYVLQKKRAFWVERKCSRLGRTTPLRDSVSSHLYMEFQRVSQVVSKDFAD
jgi:hypothetical protein